MKTILILILTAFAGSVYAEEKGACEKRAEEYATELDNVLYNFEGPFQGDSPYISGTKLDSKINTSSNKSMPMYFEETYSVVIDHSNEDGDWWVNTFKVTLTAVVDKDGSAACYIKNYSFVGTTDSGSAEDFEE